MKEARGDRILRQTFRFDTVDLAANRAGRLSPRQTALLGAGRAGMILSMAVFSAVMLGTVGFVAFMDRRLGAAGGAASGVGVAAAVAAAVIVLGVLLGRRHLAAARPRQPSAAQGVVEVLSDSDTDCRVRIGATRLRLAHPAQLEAFASGSEYRVYYLEGPVAIVLSAEAVAGHAAGEAPAPEPDLGAPDAPAPITVARRGYVVVILLGALALGIPFAGVLLGGLPSGLRPAAWAGLVAVAAGFAWLAMAWLDPGRRGRG